MLILGIETSCDETGAAVIRAEGKTNSVELLSNNLATSLTLHATTGGIIPENAAREQIKFAVPVIKEALSNAKVEPKDIDAIGVTYGPGLIGSLLIGVETAKVLSYTWNKPLIPVNHLIGHIYANFIDQEKKIEFPAIGVIVSGGHTDLVLIEGHGQIQWLGGTRDDAAGEAMDKIGRVLGLPYPGGPHIEKMAQKGNPNKYNFPSPLINSDDFDFSFSGLKTAVLRQVNSIQDLDDQTISDICAGMQKAIIDVLVAKTLKAFSKHNARSILLGGGVAANSKLREELESRAPLFVPDKSLCTDNGAMIASAAYFNNRQVAWQKVDADPNLYFDQA